MSFSTRHPFLLSDGRRFASLECAARSALSLQRTATVTDERSGKLYTWDDCRRAAR